MSNFCRNLTVWLVIVLIKGQVALEDKTVYLCQKSVITMKNQVRPVCSPKDKIWSQTDKLQRCRRLPLEQAKLRQILENNSECVLIRKWFDRWYVAESLCYKLRCKINLACEQATFRTPRKRAPTVRVFTFSYFLRPRSLNSISNGLCKHTPAGLITLTPH